MEQTGFINRYNYARFAFGKRLHAWLPYFSFNIPAAFIGHPNRRGFPQDYFSGEFLCDVPRTTNMTQRQLEIMSDMMIAKLNFFIKNEESLINLIEERKNRLRVTFNTRFNNFVDAI